MFPVFKVYFAMLLNNEDIIWNLKGVLQQNSTQMSTWIKTSIKGRTKSYVSELNHFSMELKNTFVQLLKLIKN